MYIFLYCTTFMFRFYFPSWIQREKIVYLLARYSRRLLKSFILLFLRNQILTIMIGFVWRTLMSDAYSFKHNSVMCEET